MQALTLLFMITTLAVASPTPVAKPQAEVIPIFLTPEGIVAATAVAAVGAAALGTAYVVDGGIHCAKNSYDRGVGKIPGGNRCKNRIREAGLCYKPCRDGYHGSATRCYLDHCFASSTVGNWVNGKPSS